MKKFVLTLVGAALAVSFAAGAARAQTGAVTKGPDPTVLRDLELEKEYKKNLEVARHYFRMKKAYVAALSRSEEIIDGYPQFSRLDEALYIAGMSSLYLSERKGKQAPPTHPPEKAQQYEPERLRNLARYNLSRVVTEFPDSKFRKDAEKTLQTLGPETKSSSQ